MHLLSLIREQLTIAEIDYNDAEPRLSLLASVL
jgi:hypothetical protein